jgi:hypothetical protein
MPRIAHKKRRHHGVQVTIHEEFHRALTEIATKDRRSLQGTLHLILCERLARPDLIEAIRITAVATATH